jgi:NAD+ synthase (glutamine-hydrolysing)
VHPIRIALAQLNPIVGDVAGNAARVLDALRRAAGERADLVVFSELVLLGYPPKDLLLKKRLIDENVRAVQEIAEACRGLTALVGYAQPTGANAGRPLFNAVAVCRDGRVVRSHHKSLLPTYDVFDEDRYFEPGRPGEVEIILDTAGREWPIGVSICEDLWNDETVVAHRRYPRNPAVDLVAAGAKLLVNLSASPYSVGKDEYRRSLFGAQSTRHGVPLVCVNQVGGNDDLIFDGASSVFAPNRGQIARARAFDEDLLVVDLDPEPRPGRMEPYPEPLESIYAALVLGTRDYVRKCGFKGVVVGLSGGIDSALTAVIAVEALGREAVHGVAMPSRFSSDHSVADAKLLAANLGIDFRILPIETAHRAMETVLADPFAGRPADIAEENVQARIRGNLMMALSNKFGWLLLTTGNKSEIAVGYCTLYGDMCGGLAVISDVPKTTVYELARLVNRRAGRDLIPRGSLEKPPSAELRPHQTDQDTLPPYDVLDAILKRYVEDLASADEIIAEGFDPAVVRDVARKVDMNEYKRKQAALGLRVTSRAFGSGRRMPIAARFNP